MLTGVPSAPGVRGTLRRDWVGIRSCAVALSTLPELMEDCRSRCRDWTRDLGERLGINDIIISFIIIITVECC